MADSERCIRCKKELDEAFQISMLTGICAGCWEAENVVGNEIPEGTIKELFYDENGNVISRRIQGPPPTEEELLAMGIDRKANMLEFMEVSTITDKLQTFIVNASLKVKSEEAKKLLLHLDEWIENHTWEDE